MSEIKKHSFKLRIDQKAIQHHKAFHTVKWAAHNNFQIVHGSVFPRFIYWLPKTFRETPSHNYRQRIAWPSPPWKYFHYFYFIRYLTDKRKLKTSIMIQVRFLERINLLLLRIYYFLNHYWKYCIYLSSKEIRRKAYLFHYISLDFNGRSYGVVPGTKTCHHN